MLSVLIPVHNYRISRLVSQIAEQLKRTAIDYEIIVWDDCSKASYQEANQDIKHIENLIYQTSPSNLGRTKTRDLLAQKATYDWLLFLDADVLPKSENFIANYLKYATKQNTVVYGGFCYSEPENKHHSLRYTFGKNREEKDAELRNKKPYKVIISANLLIRKECFIQANTLIKNYYGLDYYFSSQLKTLGIGVTHINNEVYHLGLEDNDQFLKKTKKAISTLYELNRQGIIKNSDVSILKAFKLLKKLKLTRLVASSFNMLKNTLETNLFSKNPSMVVFDFYRLGYFCFLNHSKT